MKCARRPPLQHPLAAVFDRSVDSLGAALNPDTIRHYRGTVRNFLSYLGAAHPAVDSLDQLRREPHLLGWMSRLRSQVAAARDRLLYQPAHRSARHLHRTGMDAPASSTRTPDPSRGYPPPAAKTPTPAHRRAGSAPAAGVRQPQRSGWECLSADPPHRHAHRGMCRLVLRLPPLDRPRSMGDSRAARQTQNGTYGAGGFVWWWHSSNACDSFAPSIRCLPMAGSWPVRAPRKPSFVNSAITCTRSVIPWASPPASSHISFATPMPRRCFAPGVSFPALMKLLGHTSPEMTMLYVEVALVDLQREFQLARSKASPSGSPAENLLRPLSNWSRWSHRFLAGRSTCTGDVPAGAADRCCTQLPRPALQPPHQNRRRSAQTPHTLRMGRDWPVMSPHSEHTLMWS